MENCRYEGTLHLPPSPLLCSLLNPGQPWPQGAPIFCQRVSTFADLLSELWLHLNAKEGRAYGPNFHSEKCYLQSATDVYRLIKITFGCAVNAQEFLKVCFANNKPLIWTLLQQHAHLFISICCPRAAASSARQLVQRPFIQSLIWIQLIETQTLSYFRKDQLAWPTGQARANRYRPIVAEAHLPDGAARDRCWWSKLFSGDLRRKP